MGKARAKPDDWTAERWQSATDPLPMLDWLGRRLGERKQRLFAIACCRPLGILFQTPGKRKAPTVEAAFHAALAVAERLADGPVGAEEHAEAFRRAAEAGKDVLADWMAHAQVAATWAMADGADHEHLQSLRAIGYSLRRDPPDPWAANAARVAKWADPSLRFRQAHVLRDIVGDPFRAVGFDSAWRTTTAAAEAIYADSAFDRLPILADALEDAGCTDAVILDHCRQPGEHARGCWVVDLVLAKE